MHEVRLCGIGRMMLTGEKRSIERGGPVSVPLYQPQILRNLAGDRTQVSMMEGLSRVSL
jgi:hypothetical protein